MPRGLARSRLVVRGRAVARVRYVHGFDGGLGRAAIIPRAAASRQPADLSFLFFGIPGALCENTSAPVVCLYVDGTPPGRKNTRRRKIAARRTELGTAQGLRCG